MKLKKQKLIAATLLIIVIVVGVFLVLPLFSRTAEDGGILSPKPEPVPVEPVDISILCAGDVMAHSTQLKAQLQADGTYDFSDNYIYIKPYVEAADVAICNVETTFAGEPYTGYPAFGSPDSLATALKDAGFDIASTANNHMMDRHLKGALRTVQVLRDAGLKTTGCVETQEEPRYAMYETAKGIKVAVIGYTYQNSTGDSRVSINGSVVDSESAWHINSFNYAFIDSELTKIRGVAEDARAAGADIIALFYHWGEEYQLSANKWQVYMAEQSAATMDVDLIFGSHPHVLQNTDMLSRDHWITVDSDGNPVNVEVDMDNPDDIPEGISWANKQRKIPVFYSLGNLVSNQRAETLNNKYTEEGVLAQVNIRIQPDTGEILDVQMSGIPTWVDRYSSGGKNKYCIIPLDENVESNETLLTSGHMSRALDAREVARGILGFN